jgi:hypothetical protein
VIEKSVVLPCSVEEAFALFAGRINDWWPPERRHHSHPDSVIALTKERLFETDPSGHAVELGLVRSWEPPFRIVLDWYPGTDSEHPTEVEVRFMPVGTFTRIEVKHGPGPASIELFPTRAPRYAASWDLVLGALLRAASA